METGLNAQVAVRIMVTANRIILTTKIVEINGIHADFNEMSLAHHC